MITHSFTSNFTLLASHLPLILFSDVHKSSSSSSMICLRVLFRSIQVYWWTQGNSSSLTTVLYPYKQSLNWSLSWRNTTLERRAGGRPLKSCEEAISTHFSISLRGCYETVSHHLLGSEEGQATQHQGIPQLVLPSLPFVWVSSFLVCRTRSSPLWFTLLPAICNELSKSKSGSLYLYGLTSQALALPYLLNVGEFGSIGSFSFFKIRNKFTQLQSFQSFLFLRIEDSYDLEQLVVARCLIIFPPICTSFHSYPSSPHTS